MSLNSIKINTNQVVKVDEQPTAESDNLVKSGGVYEIAQSVGIYDICIFTVNNNNSDGTSGKTIGPMEYSVSISISSIVKFTIQNLQKNR